MRGNVSVWGLFLPMGEGVVPPLGGVIRFVLHIFWFNKQLRFQGNGLRDRITVAAGVPRTIDDDSLVLRVGVPQVFSQQILSTVRAYLLGLCHSLPLPGRSRRP